MESTPPTGIPAEESPPVPEQAVAVEEPVIEEAPAPPQVLSDSSFTIGVPREIVPGERRVALVPDTVKRLVAQGQRVVVEANAGEAAHFLDEATQPQVRRSCRTTRLSSKQANLIVKVQKADPG